MLFFSHDASRGRRRRATEKTVRASTESCGAHLDVGRIGLRRNDVLKRGRPRDLRRELANLSSADAGNRNWVAAAWSNFEHEIANFVAVVGGGGVGGNARKSFFWAG